MSRTIHFGEKWDRRFLELARHVAGWSKDPSTPVGAVIADPDRRIVSLGYNGFPRGVDDWDARYKDRDLKYRMVIHAERNALLFAARPVEGCVLFTWPFAPCSVCAGMAIQSGIARVVAPTLPAELVERWGPDLDVSRLMFGEADVILSIIDTEGK
jgi:Deoxycytidylate deaminase